MTQEFSKTLVDYTLNKYKVCGKGLLALAWDITRIAVNDGLALFAKLLVLTTFSILYSPTT